MLESALEPQLANRGPRGILTIAFGDQRFIEMAKSLARSLLIHDPEIPRAVVTDSSDPKLHSLFTHIVDYRPEYGSNLRQKMHIDLYSPFDETLFVDSDCLVVHKLDPYWRTFQTAPFGLSGNYCVLRAGASEEYMDVDFLLERFSVSGLPKFNGGIYYFKRTPEANAVFKTARMLMENFRELRFKEFRGDGPNDESLYSVAMAIHGLSITSMGEGGMWTPINSKGKITIDILGGICHFMKEGRQVKPDIIHFATVWSNIYLYRRECLRLSKFVEGQATDLLLSEIVSLRIAAAKKRISHGVMRRVRKLAPVRA
jgi:hypothetical protein